MNITIEDVKKDLVLLGKMESQTEEACLAAIRANEWAIQYVKEQTSKLCIEAVKQNGSMLYFVNNQTPEVCMAAVEKGGFFEQFIPFSSEDGYELDHIVTSYVDVSGIPDNYFDREEYRSKICHEIEKPVLAFVEDGFKTPEICVVALKNAWNADRELGLSGNKVATVWNFVPENIVEQVKNILQSEGFEEIVNEVFEEREGR